MDNRFSQKDTVSSPSLAGALPGPDDITRVELPNGIVILSRSNFNSPSIVINGYLPAGGIFDPDEMLGLADFTASALMRGVERYDFLQIYDSLESVGASLGMNGGVHLVSFNGRALAEDLDLLLDLLSEALCKPTFPIDQVERLRAQILTGLSIRAQSTREMASLTFDQIVYNEHPYSRPEEGYPETVSAITREDLVAFHNHHYGPGGMVLALVGAIESQQVVDKVTEVFGDWHNPNQPEPPELPPVQLLSEPVTRQHEIRGKSQADIVIGAPGPARFSPDYLAASLGNSILGQFGMMGRIGSVVRDREGLAYYAYSNLSGGLGPGPWTVSAGVDPANVDRAIELIQAEIGNFVREGVTQDELEDVQQQSVGSLPLSLESNAGVAGALVSIERYNLGLDYLWRYPDLIRSITTGDVLRAAQTYLDPQRLGIAVAGPFST